MRELLLLLIGTIIQSTANAQTINASQVKDYVGKNVTVCDQVVGVKFECTVDRQPTFMDFGVNNPGEAFTALVWQDDLNKFSYSLKTLEGKRVCVSGVLALDKARPEMIIHDPQAIKTKKDTEDWLTHNLNSYFSYHEFGFPFKPLLRTYSIYSFEGNILKEFRSFTLKDSTDSLKDYCTTKYIDLSKVIKVYSDSRSHSAYMIFDFAPHYELRGIVVDCKTNIGRELTYENFAIGSTDYLKQDVLKDDLLDRMVKAFEVLAVLNGAELY